MTADLRAQFAEALLRESTPILDNVGICVQMSKLPSAERLRIARRRLYGTHWLSRLWCRKIRPWLCPIKHGILSTNVRALEERQRAEFLDEIFNQARVLGYIE
jgi:hypothetical protein